MFFCNSVLDKFLRARAWGNCWVGGRLRDQSHFGHGVTKTHRKNFKEKTKIFFSKNLSICQFWLFSSVKWDLHPTEIHWKNCARKMTKAERGTREVFGIFRVLRLDINLFFGENNVFNMFWVNEKLLEAFILLSVQFWNFRFFKKKGAISWPFGHGVTIFGHGVTNFGHGVTNWSRSRPTTVVFT